MPTQMSPGDRALSLMNKEPEDAVQSLLDLAADMNASDLFLAINENNAVISARYLGVVHHIADITPSMCRRFVSHIKAKAGMDVAERRRPLDGRMLIDRENGLKLDVRLNTIPTLHGEDCTIRILKQESILRDLESLGLLRPQRNILMQPLNSPAGLVLVTGPTGSGKTTTLYSCLQYLKTGSRKISTIEDPIEFAVDGLRQSQINMKLDLDFPDLLRSVLRQSPDVIMIGEIRDEITAATAVRAANSGHLVFSTLHAPIAAGAIHIMLSLGVNPHFLASALQAVIAQRLVRTLCEDCRQPFDMSHSPYTFEDIEDWLEEGEQRSIYGPQGCEKCYQTGYRSRIGVFEVMPINGTIRRMITDWRSTQEMEKSAIETGMLEFRRAALIAVARGLTSIEEVLRVVPTEYLGLSD